MNEERTIWPDRKAVDASLLFLRVIVGVIFAAHGAQKLLGVWGGPGLRAMMEMMGPPLGFLVTIGEFFGGIGLIFGFLTRFSAASLIVIMIGAIALEHGQHGFFGPKGFEYNLALIGLLLPIMICGPGRYSIGHLFLRKSKTTGRPIVVLE